MLILNRNLWTDAKVLTDKKASRLHVVCKRIKLNLKQTGCTISLAYVNLYRFRIVTHDKTSERNTNV